MAIYTLKSYFFNSIFGITLGPSKLENVADPGSGPRGPAHKEKKIVKTKRVKNNMINFSIFFSFHQDHSRDIG